jgi:outer membrane protein assembly factor BamE (lipoprotein component of BamABCDE complex)
MTNDEFRMTKKIQMRNDERTKASSNRISSFALRHSFVIRRLSFILLTLLVLMLDSCIGKRITKANVDEVTEGMSKKQVESILGQPTSSKTEGPMIIRQTTYVYRQGKDTVTIVFKEDKVQSKDSTISD